ncbi:hypothetical protein LCGC14_1082980 [marine sediment metagenome]|uniref:Uncharacterized protein n=1 Tax=marine sediment metagenome TaxID=412755 RepID=A0A0F9MJ71_9ZZZZ|nr:hypothetical protein [Pricia sp.]
MKILEIYPKDVYVKVEFSLKQILHLVSFLNNSVVEYSSEEKPAVHEAVSYVKNDLFPQLDTLLEDMQQGGQDDT